MSIPLNGHQPAALEVRRPLPKDIATRSVQQFFSQIPWEGVKAMPQWAVAPTPGIETVPQPLSKQLSVTQFFSHFLWEGTPTIGAPGVAMTLQEDPIPATEAFTLDDFSSLF